VTECSLAIVQRLALALLFTAIAACLGGIALYAALSGGRAWVIALAAAGLAVWMGDFARRLWRR
jgi:phosphatidylserine synthase